MLRTQLTESEVRPRLRELMDTLFKEVPTGLGGGGRLRLDRKEIDQVLRRGAGWAVEQGYGDPDDLEVTEDKGCIAGADHQAVGDRPKTRGAPQLGTVGSGNHFLEVQAVTEVLDPVAAEVMGISEPGQVAVLIHCGSRGLGHQVCTDSLKVIEAASDRYGIRLPDPPASGGAGGITRRSGLPRRHEGSCQFCLGQPSMSGTLDSAGFPASVRSPLEGVGYVPGLRREPQHG